MTLKLVKGLLASRAIREKAGGVKGKIRYLDVTHPITRQGEEKNFLDQIGDAFNGLKGFITSNGWWARLFGNGLTAVFNWGMQKLTQLVNFDFNQSDKQLMSLINAEGNRLASVFGSLAGQALGWTVAIAVGYGVSLVIPVIGGAALAKAVTAIAKAEGLEQVTSGIGGALLETIGAIGTTALVGGYLLARKAAKGGKESKGGPVFSVSAGFEALVNMIPLDFVRTFINSAVDSAVDSFWEAGTIMAYEIDNAYEQAKRAQDNTRGVKRTIRLTPNKALKGEQLIITGTQADLEQSVTETMNTYRLIANRDVGQIVGMPAEDFVSAKPLRRQLTIVFRAKKEPPYRMPNGKPAKSVTITIPDVIVGLSWQRIKAAALKFTWGKFRATAHLDNGRQMAVYGATKGEAEKTIKRLITLSTAKILSLNVTEEGEKKNINLRKDPTPMFPSNATLLVRRPTTGEDGRQFTDNTKMTADRIRIDLYMDVQPKGIPPLK